VFPVGFERTRVEGTGASQFSRKRWNSYYYLDNFHNNRRYATCLEEALKSIILEALAKENSWLR
jgi:hypothetical protein